MKPEDLKEEVEIEMQLVEATVRELAALRADVGDRMPTIREKTAAAAFLAQFYGGIENILKRICKYNNLPPPTGDTWHVDLFKQFCDPPKSPLPLLFDKALASALVPFRRFRHVVYHGYGFQLEWERMNKGVAEIEDIFESVKGAIYSYIKTT